MASLKADPNKGPIKLEHDITPRDMKHINMVGLSSSFGLNDSHRFQGFPESNFQEGRQPLLGSPKDIPTVRYRKPQHFVKGRPNTVSKNGVQYSSDEHSEKTNLPISPKKKTPFWNEDRTSAEERKKERQNREAQWDQAQYKKMRESNMKATVEEKKKDLQMLKDYKPFGRAGGGAPRREQEAYRTKAVDVNELNKGPELIDYGFGKPGHGAPLRTDSGKVITNIRANNDIRFRDGLGMRRGIENKTRYTNPKEFGDKINNELGNMALEKRTQKEMERQIEKVEERRTWDFNPFGKAGAGAPIKTDSGTLVTARARTLAKDPLELKQIEDKPHMKRLLPGEKDEKFDPWGKGQGVPEYDTNGNTKRLRWNHPTTAVENYDHNTVGVGLKTKSFGGGGHLIDEKGEKKTRLQQTLQQGSNPGGIYRSHVFVTQRLSYKIKDKLTKDMGGEAIPKDQPWGKPGGGAPMYLENGQILATNRGKAVKDQMGYQPPKTEELVAKKNYLDSLKTEIETQKIQRRREMEDVKKPGEETINWIRSKEVGYPPRDPATGSHLPVHHKGTSDVTKHVMDIRRPGMDARDYRTELVRQAEQRAYRKDVEKKESRQAANEHFNKFETQWGRPGNGAPYEPARTRHSLDTERFHDVQKEIQKPIGPREQPWGRTRALEDRFREPKFQPQVPKQSLFVPRAGIPTGVQNTTQYEVKAPWAAFSV